MRGLVLASVAPLMLISAVALADPAQPTTAPQAAAQPMQPATSTTQTMGTASQTPQATVQTAAAPAYDPNEIICKTMAAPTGTRLGGRNECHTREQWDQRTREEQRMLQQQQNTGIHNPNG